MQSQVNEQDTFSRNGGFSRSFYPPSLRAVSVHSHLLMLDAHSVFTLRLAGLYDTIRRPECYAVQQCTTLYRMNQTFPHDKRF